MAYYNASGVDSESIFVEFECDFIVPSENYVLAVCGSIPELGNWNPRVSLIADESYKGSGKWIAKTHLPAGMCFEWKWVVIHREHYSAYRWEECENRISTLGKHSGRYLAPWNNAMVFNEESCTAENDERQPNLIEEHTTPNPEIGTQVVSRFAPFSRRLFGRIFGLFYDTRSLIFSTFEAVRNIMVRSSYRRGGRGSSMEDERNLRMWV